MWIFSRRSFVTLVLMSGFGAPLGVSVSSAPGRTWILSEADI
jgi:hypothetical protein